MRRRLNVWACVCVMCVTGQIFHGEADSFPDCPESVGEREQSWDLQASALSPLAAAFYTEQR